MGESTRSIIVTNTVLPMSKGSLERGRMLLSQYRKEIMEMKQVTAQYGIVPVEACGYCTTSDIWREFQLDQLFEYIIRK